MPVGLWQGIKRGCFCNDGTVIDYHKCAIRSDCKFVSSQSSRDLLNWKEDAAKKTLSFCQKPDTEWSRQVSCTGSQTQCASDICKAGSKDNLCAFNSLECTSPWGLKKTHKHAFNHEQVKTQSFTFTGVNSEAQKCTATFKDSDKNSNRQFVEFVASSKAGVVCLDPWADSPKKDGTTDIKVEYPLYRQLSVENCGTYGELQNSANKLTIDLKSTKKAKDIFTINDVQSIINAEVPENFRNLNYDLHLNAVAKIPINLKESCIGFDLESFGGISNWGTRTGVFIRVFDWIIIIGSSLLFLLALIFVGSLVSPFLSQKERTKVQLARFYVVFSFVLVFIALLGSALYYFLFRHFLNKYADSVSYFKGESCITEPKGVNIAIDNLNKYEKGLLSDYGNLISWWFWTAIVYWVLWIIISKIQRK